MIEFDQKGIVLSGPQGQLAVRNDDEITLKLAMLFEGECEGRSRAECAQKFHYSRQRYYQLLQKFLAEGAAGLQSQKRGPQGCSRRTEEVIREIIRYRFVDPQQAAEVIAQKLTQSGRPIAMRSVERVITEYGLQKKTYISRRRPAKG